jgi:hypothetical protein
MTEAEWLGPGDALKVLDACSWLGATKKNRRKLRLWACACCRRLGDLLHEQSSREAVAVAERNADGLADPDEVRAVRKAAGLVPQVRRLDVTAWDWAASAAHLLLSVSLVEGTQTVAIRAAMALGMSGKTTREAEDHSQYELLRDIFGNPFRAVKPAPRWRTPAARDLAQTMYESRGFATMPILADALEEAGCDNADVLAHCRGDGSHVRGCWVVDLVLAKE